MYQSTGGGKPTDDYDPSFPHRESGVSRGFPMSLYQSNIIDPEA